MKKSRYYKRDDVGLERALQHIEEAKQLSQELGGTDKDVKGYFFSLSKDKLKKLFNDYGDKFGEDKKNYAMETYEDWKTGKRQMSGLVASRLYSMLPPTMPLETKYSMVKTLWDKYGPCTNKILVAGVDSTAEEVHLKASEHLLKTVEDWEVNTNLKKRFKWLSGGDVQIQEKLLNHFKDFEKNQIIEGLKNKVPVLLQFKKENQDISGSLNEKIKIGNHKLEIKFDLETEGIELFDPEEYVDASYEDYNSHLNKKGNDYTGWIIFFIVIVIIISLTS